MAKNVNVMALAAVLVFFVVLAGSATAQEGGFGGAAAPVNYFVDVVHGSDDNEGLTPGTAFATIRKGIHEADDGDTVLVYPGIYQEEVNFLGKSLVVQGVVLGSAGIPVLENPDDYAVSFYNGEGPDSILKNFIIKNNFMAIFIAGSSPTISNLTIVDNLFGIEVSTGSDPNISNIVFWNNTYSELFGCQAQYSRVSDASTGEGNIDADPLFVDPEKSDYHLRSNRGRYWPEHNVWILDRQSSPCIDGGDPSLDPLDEPIPNGGRINMGAYGGTVQASMSPDRPPGQAFNPSPPNGAIGVDRNTILSWDPGLDAVMHEIYFGTETSPPFVSGQTAKQYDPGRMDSNTVYYWRIDEIDSKGYKTVGAIWKFTTIIAAPPKGRTCFVAETGVWVDGALVSISNVAQGQINCGEKSFGKVQEVQEHQGTFECYDVLLKSGNIIGVAGNHYFLTESGQWLALRNLRAGTRLQTPNGSIGIVSVTKRLTPYVGKVYNLKVEGSDRYLVGKDAVMVRDY